MREPLVHVTFIYLNLLDSNLLMPTPGPCALTALTVIAMHAAAQDYPEPGRYKVQATIASDQPPASVRHESEQCIHYDQLQTDPSTWMQAQPSQNCEVIEYRLSGGNINMSRECTGPGVGVAGITGTGSFTNHGLHMQNVARMSSAGFDMTTTTQLISKRMGDC